MSGKGGPQSNNIHGNQGDNFDSTHSNNTSLQRHNQVLKMLEKRRAEK